MYSTANNKNKSTPVQLHIDTNPLSISIYDSHNTSSLKKGSAHAVVSPVLTKQGLHHNNNNHNNTTAASVLSPFPSPSSSTSSVTASPLDHESKSFPQRIDASRSKRQLVRPSQSLNNSQQVTTKSWESIKSPAASFLAGFAFSPTSTTDNSNIVFEEKTGDEIDDYALDKIIGFGGFSTVRKGFRISDGQKVAVKIIKKNLDSSENRLEQELSIWKSLHHHHIVCLEKILETDHATFLVCDYCPNDNLFSKLKNSNGLAEHEARRIFRELCSAVAYLHNDARICHKDLKLENILFDENDHVKVCDFGLTVYQQPPVTKINGIQSPITASSTSNNCKEDDMAAGSLAYAAPEQVKSAKALPCPKTDIWSLGVILYALVTAQLPFHDDYELRLQKKILDGKFSMPNNISPELQDLLNHCLDMEVNSRFDINQILTSEWLNMF